MIFGRKQLQELVLLHLICMNNSNNGPANNNNSNSNSNQIEIGKLL